MGLKKIMSKVPYYLPGVGLAVHTIKEYKSRRGRNPWYNVRESKDRRALANYVVQTGYLTLAILWKVYLGSYVGKAINTGDWHPFRFNEELKTEKFQETRNIDKKLEKERNLEKNIYLEEIIK